MDNSGADSSGNGHNLNLSGTDAYVSEQSSVGGYSLRSSSGASNYAYADDSPTWPNGSNITLEAWVRANTTTGDQGIISKYTGGSADFYLKYTSGTIYFYIFAGGSGTVTSNGSLTLNTWTHVAGVYNGSKMCIFIGGGNVGCVDKSGSLVDTSNIVKIGNDYTGQDRAFQGYIDEVRVSNTSRYTANFTHPTLNSGSIASKVFNSSPVGARWISLTAINTTNPPTTDIKYQVRASDASFNPTDAAPGWTNVTLGALPNGVVGRYFQWRANLSTTDNTTSPVLDSVTAVWCVDPDCPGGGAAATPTNLSVRLSGEFDYKDTERNYWLVAFVRDKDTGAAVSGANVTISIFDDKGNVQVNNASMTAVSNTAGTFVYNGTMDALNIPAARSAAYIADVTARLGGNSSTDAMVFHVDPLPPEPVPSWVIYGGLAAAIAFLALRQRRPRR